MYSVSLQLFVQGPERADHFALVTDRYAELEQADPNLLDSSFGLTDEKEHGVVDIELTVNAADEDIAFTLGIGSVRAAIHAAGGCTPDWDDRADRTGAVVYVAGSRDVELV